MRPVTSRLLQVGMLGWAIGFVAGGGAVERPTAAIVERVPALRPGEPDVALERLKEKVAANNARIFADGFETGDTSRWGGRTVLAMQTALCGTSARNTLKVVVQTPDPRRHRVNEGPWSIATRRSWHSVVIPEGQTWNLDVDVDPGFNGAFTRFRHPIAPGLTGGGTPLCDS